MKSALQNLLVGCALGLCALCVWQWHIQVRQYRELTTLAQTIANQAAAIQHSTNSLAVLDLQIAQQDTQLRQLRNMTTTQHAELAALRGETNRLTSSLLQAHAAAAAQIQQANATIHQQNESLKNMVTQRDDFVKRLNEVIQDRNAVVTKYNDLAKRLAESPAAPPHSAPTTKP